MAIYSVRDIKTDLSGDFVISSRGDLQLATTEETMVQHAAWRLRTSPYDFTAPDKQIGANLQVFIGEHISEDLFTDMEDQVRVSLVDGLFEPDDLFITVIPIDINEVMIYTKVEGLFVDDNGLLESNGFEGAFSFPMYEGDSIQMTSYQSL